MKNFMQYKESIMNAKQKLYLATLMDRMYYKWYDYTLSEKSVKKELTDCSLPDEYKTALRLSDVSILEECAMAKLEGACEVLNLKAVFDNSKAEIRVENKKGKILLWTNGTESNYNFDELCMECIK